MILGTRRDSLLRCELSFPLRFRLPMGDSASRIVSNVLRLSLQVDFTHYFLAFFILQFYNFFLIPFSLFLFRISSKCDLLVALAGELFDRFGGAMRFLTKTFSVDFKEILV